MDIASTMSELTMKNAKYKEEDVDADDAEVSLKQKVENVVEIKCRDDSYTPGQYSHIICPMCKGGQSKKRSLWFHINQNEKFSMWRCSNLECEWAAHILDDASPTKDEIKSLSKPTEENWQLEPIGDELIKYLAGRMISAEILQKNAVMQKTGDKSVIAFTYRRNGELVSCKCRSTKIKDYWQEKNGEKILYGLDGIKEGNDIVIVEGEIDKLSMEQAGILNCVSVPNGAPQKVPKMLPTKREDSNLQYLSDCYTYLDKAPRIIVATDGDKCGQALAEVLASVLGRERCWRVTWPKKDESSCYKDANEVLVHLGAEALRHVIETAEKYEILDDPTEDEVKKKPSVETLRLEPLGDTLIEYFARRMISAETLQKNAVMQIIDDKNVIAYTYRRNGELVNCNFYSITSRKFWQAKNGERILYGLDGIKEGNDHIVIVADELDKLSMEQAGIPNCISLPVSAPQKVSKKALSEKRKVADKLAKLSLEQAGIPNCTSLPVSAPQKVSKKALSEKRKESRLKYLLDCNGVKNASRIILATHDNRPGPALAELSSVLGKERCWRVTWPMKDGSSCYKDANEVLVHLGAEALRHIVETAELYEVQEMKASPSVVCASYKPEVANWVGCVGTYTGHKQIYNPDQKSTGQNELS